MTNTAEKYEQSNVAEFKGKKPNDAEFQNLGDLWTMKKSAGDAYNDAAKAIAEKYNIDASELKAYVAAKEQDKLAEHQKKLDDRQLLLEV